MSEGSERIQKKVDEAWKAQVEKERVLRSETAPAEEKASASPGEQADLRFFLSSLSMQAMTALGELPHPVTNQRHEDLEQARTLIDILGMLKEKTKGNLTGEEASLLDGVLYELRMKYVAKSQGSNDPVR
ncbi:MAG: DUF1844 domain-containing protein [Candidatus Omnitrophica bacterium]|nr:DUF1844 domain-containing protein [Candidatus Omnitrophota bacterium]